MLYEVKFDFGLTPISRVLGFVYNRPVFIAGGCFASLIRGETPKDYDIFFTNEEDRITVFSRLADISVEQASICCDKNRAVEIEKSGFVLHLVTSLGYSSLEQLLESMDFYHCAIGMGNDEKVYSLHPTSVDLARTKSLSIIPKAMEERSIGVIIRMMKFLKRGYHLSNRNQMESLIYYLSQNGKSIENDRDTFGEYVWSCSAMQEICKPQ